MDKSNYLDETFFINNGVTSKGQEFIDYFKEFSTKVESVSSSGPGLLLDSGVLF